MTQVASPETARADFDGVTVDAVHGRPMRWPRDGQQFWAEFDDPDWDRPRQPRRGSSARW